MQQCWLDYANGMYEHIKFFIDKGK
jgi:hypothetical protein